MFKGYTLLSQFNQHFSNAAVDSYLLFKIVKGYFDENGNADVFTKVSLKEVIRLDISFNEKGEIGWLEQENKKDFYFSEDITEIWTSKFFKAVLTK